MRTKLVGVTALLLAVGPAVGCEAPITAARLAGDRMSLR
jgi:hypothetical protein